MGREGMDSLIRLTEAAEKGLQNLVKVIELNQTCNILRKFDREID